MAMSNGIDLSVAAACSSSTSPASNPAPPPPPPPPSSTTTTIVTSTADKPHALKPLEELTDADIRQLTREDCRRYLKERGMRRPSWNKAQAIQQVLSLRSLICSSKPAENDKAATVSHPGAAVTGHTRQYVDKVSQQSMPHYSPSSNNTSDPPRHLGYFGSPLGGQQQSFVSAPPPPPFDAAAAAAAAAATSAVKTAPSLLPARSAATSGKPHRAQLTIFYSGLVNVYDDVPLEKAQAIMLLAGSKTFQLPSPVVPCMISTTIPQQATTPAVTSASTISAADAAAAAAAPPAPNPVYAHTPSPPEPLPAATTPPACPAAQFINVQHEEGTTDPGLPQARTASLQRFLAKRRERISAHPSSYRRSEKPKRRKPSSSPPPLPLPQPLAASSPQAAAAAFLSTNHNYNNNNMNNHNPHNQEQEHQQQQDSGDDFSFSRSSASSDSTSGASFQTTATTPRGGSSSKPFHQISNIEKVVLAI